MSIGINIVEGAACGPRTPRRSRYGFTLIELMVSVAVLSILIVIFGGILSQAQSVVNRSTDEIGMDRDLMSVNGVIRRDFTNLTKRGFLKISGGNHIAFTVVGSFESLYDESLSSNAAVVDYGCTTEDDDDEVGNKDGVPPAEILWRRHHLLLPGQDTDAEDVIDASLPEASEEKNQPFYKGNVRKAPAIQLPPTRPADWGPFLVDNCTDFKVFWCTRVGTEWVWSEEGESGDWTHDNPNDWPKALRIRFELKDEPLEVFVNLD